MNCLPQMSCLRPRFPQNLTLKTPDIAQRVLSDLSVPPALAPANHLPLLTTLHSGHAVLPPTCLPSGSPLLAPLSRCPDPLRDTTGKTTFTFYASPCPAFAPLLQEHKCTPHPPSNLP